jgi:signal transduction histidine kinase
MTQVRLPLFVKIMTPVVLLIILAVGISGFRIYQQADERLQTDLDTRLQQAATYMAANLDLETLNQIQEPSDQNSAAYILLENELELARQAGDLAWIGLYRREGNYLYYWVDADSTGVGYPFFHATPEHFAAFDQKTVQRLQYHDEFGSYYGFAAPIVVEGQVIGIVEAVVSDETRQLVERGALANALPILIFGVVVAVLFSLLVTHYVFSRPLSRLQAGAQILASGQFGFQIPLTTRDELGDLARTFNQMSTQIERLYLEKVREERARREREIGQLKEAERILEAKVAQRTAEIGSKNEELLKSQEELAVAHDQALEASSAKSAFLAHMSHELRTPLNVIMGYAEILHNLAARTQQSEWIAPLLQIRSSAQHILHQVNEVLDLSKIESGKMELYLETIDLVELIDDVAAIMEPLVKRNDNRLVVNCDRNLGDMWADPTKIRQALLNLLSNSSKFTEDGVITISATRAPMVVGGPDAIMFTVSDTGVGIPADKMATLFEDYSQAHGQTSHRLGGTGLGLAITQRFCKLMGGSLSATSEGLDKGATFTIRLPARVEKVVHE